MRPPATFETARLLLRAPRPSDARAVFDGYARDPEVVRYLVWRPHADLRETESFLARCAEGWETGAEFSWAVTLKEGGESGGGSGGEAGELIGMVGLRVRDFKADLGYVLARRWWGRGLAAEAARPVVEWALAQPAVYRVWALCDVDNAASARVLEKIGMTREGVLRRSTLHPNAGDEPRDSYCYALVK